MHVAQMPARYPDGCAERRNLGFVLFLPALHLRISARISFVIGEDPA
jgi:hypothetical protein